jgi:taurine dioxygenase
MQMTLTNTKIALRFEKVTPTIGARAAGIAVDEPPAPETVETLRAALHEHGVLFFEFGERLDVDQHRHFAGLFGEIEPVYGFSTHSPGEPGSASCIDAEHQPLKRYRTNMWHSDGTPFERPPQPAILTSVEPPVLGGGTMWSSMYAAYDDLSAHYQRLLEGLEVLHSTMRTPFVREKAQAVHPAVIRDPVTGRKALFVNSIYSERFLGMSERESDSLMHFLFEHVNMPEFHVCLTWKPGTVAVWEQRITQHRAIDSFIGPRKLSRITVKGEKPVAANGS